MSDLPERLRALADSLEGDDWHHPLLSREACREAAAILDRLPKTADGVVLVPGKDSFWLPYEINGEWKVQKLDSLFRTQFMAGVRYDEISQGYSTREAAEKARKP